MNSSKFTEHLRTGLSHGSCVNSNHICYRGILEIVPTLCIRIKHTNLQRDNWLGFKEALIFHLPLFHHRKDEGQTRLHHYSFVNIFKIKIVHVEESLLKTDEM